MADDQALALSLDGNVPSAVDEEQDSPDERPTTPISLHRNSSSNSNMSIAPTSLQGTDHRETTKILANHRVAGSICVLTILLIVLVGFFAKLHLLVPIGMDYHAPPTYEIEPTFVKSSFPITTITFLSLGVQALESAISIKWSGTFHRVVHRWNPFRETFQVTAIILAHIQVAMVVGMLDPLMLVLFGVTMEALLSLLAIADRLDEYEAIRLPLRLTSLCLAVTCWVILLIYWAFSLVTAPSVSPVLVVLVPIVFLLDLSYACTFLLMMTNARETFFLLISVCMQVIVAALIVLGLTQKSQ